MRVVFIDGKKYSFTLTKMSCNSLRWNVVLSIIVFTLVGVARGVEVEVDEVIEAPVTFDPILAEGNTSVYQSWLDLCVTDSKCAELYGLSETTSLTQFIHLITLTDPFSSSSGGGPDYLENALVYNIYNNTPEEINALILLQQMKLAILCSNFVCGINEKPKVVNGTVKCNPLPGRSPSDRNAEDIILKFMLYTGSLVILVYIVKSAYTFSNESWKESIKAYLRLHPRIPQGRNPGDGTNDGNGGNLLATQTTPSSARMDMELSERAGASILRKRTTLGESPHGTSRYEDEHDDDDGDVGDVGARDEETPSLRALPSVYIPRTTSSHQPLLASTSSYTPLDMSKSLGVGSRLPQRPSSGKGKGGGKRLGMLKKNRRT